jgi:WD40 repeat protein
MISVVVDQGTGADAARSLVRTQGCEAPSGSLDRTVRLWEAASGKEVRRFKGHKGCVARVAISADGLFAASAGWDRTVRTWRLAGAPPRS